MSRKTLKLRLPPVLPNHISVQYSKAPFNGKIKRCGLWYAVYPKDYAPIGFVYIHPRLSDKQKLKIAVHEALHATYPDLSERQVINGSIFIADIIHKAGFRKQKKHRNRSLV